MVTGNPTSGAHLSVFLNNGDTPLGRSATTCSVRRRPRAPARTSMATSAPIFCLAPTAFLPPYRHIPIAEAAQELW